VARSSAGCGHMALLDLLSVARMLGRGWGTGVCPRTHVRPGQHPTRHLATELEVARGGIRPRGFSFLDECLLSGGQRSDGCRPVGKLPPCVKPEAGITIALSMAPRARGDPGRYPGPRSGRTQWWCGRAQKDLSLTGRARPARPALMRTKPSRKIRSGCPAFHGRPSRSGGAGEAARAA
jgi:hypothetical protein